MAGDKSAALPRLSSGSWNSGQFPNREPAVGWVSHRWRTESRFIHIHTGKHEPERDGMQDVFKLRYLKEKQKRLIGMKQQRPQSREILYGERTQRYGNIQHFVSFTSKPSSHKLFHDKWWRDGITFRRSKHLRSALLSACAKDPPSLTWSRWLLYFASFFFLSVIYSLHASFVHIFHSFFSPSFLPSFFCHFLLP